MRNCLYLFTLLFSYTCFSQNITVDSQSFTPQQLIEDILIDSDCITNVVVTNVVGGNFDNTDQSYGFFDATGTTFPFQSGVVLSTGRLNNVPGPNTTLSDDDAPNWSGDVDLEQALNETNTINATILEFDFTAVAQQVSFKYLFASEEYQEGNANTCQFSDLFGFLIRPINEQQYQNIALVPNTQTPVKVTTVHSGIPNACEPINETYFGSWNGADVPINFNGQTAVLEATANTIPNETYHVKLVIADEQNFRFDSAVFLEAGSFELSVDLGEDRLLSSGNPICENNTIELNALQAGNTSYKWFKDSIEQLGQTSELFEVIEAGTYTVEATLDNNCVATGEIIIEYADNPEVFDTTLIACDINQDGFTIYNLFDAESTVTNNDQGLIVTSLFFTETDAQNNTNPITTPTFFENTAPFQIVYARVENQSQCFSIAQVNLDISTNNISIPDFEVCDDDPVDGFTSFSLSELRTVITPLVPANATISFFETTDDSFANTNELSGNYVNTVENETTIYTRVRTQDGQCYALEDITLKVKATPVLLENEEILYCLNSFPETVRLQGGVINDLPSNYYYIWLKDGLDTTIDTSFIDINEPGTYTVVVTDPNGCFASRDIIVLPSDIATIEDIVIAQGSFNDNTVTVLVSGEGIYEYSIDGTNYQDSTIFEDVSAGFYTIYIRDVKNNCGIIEDIISVYGTPNYFTPNGDNIHETWRPVGLTEENSTIKFVQIFDRYGKLLADFNPVNRAWDGTFAGQNLPADDYWYIISFNNGKQLTGHFALVR